MDVTARLLDCDGQAADAVSAYTQVKMEDAPKLLKIPKSECPDVCARLPRHKWPKSWANIEDLVVLLFRSHFGSRFTARSVEKFGPLFPCRYGTHLTSSLLICTETFFVTFPPLCACIGKGLGQPARALRMRNIIDGTQTKKHILLDGAYNVSRHITVISSNQFCMSISNSIKTFAATSRPDEIQTDTATAPVDPSHAAHRAATASPSAPVPVIEHATPAPVDVCTAPARMIEHVAPSPVIDYIAPPSATTGVFTDFENPQFSFLAVEAAASQVVDSFSSGVERVHRE